MKTCAIVQTVTMWQLVFGFVLSVAAGATDDSSARLQDDGKFTGLFQPQITPLSGSYITNTIPNDYHRSLYYLRSRTDEKNLPKLSRAINEALSSHNFPKLKDLITIAGKLAENDVDKSFEFIFDDASAYTTQMRLMVLQQVDISLITEDILGDQDLAMQIVELVLLIWKKYRGKLGMSEMSQHYVSCVTQGLNDGKGCSGDYELVFDNELHRVSCCSDVALPGWASTCPSVWVQSESDGTCNYAKTYDDAKHTCITNGGRLCSKEEIQSNCVVETGCASSYDMIWSCTSCNGSTDINDCTRPSSQPSLYPSLWPTPQPSWQPSSQPSTQPSLSPSLQASAQPSLQPSLSPSLRPSPQPSSEPTLHASLQPSSLSCFDRADLIKSTSSSHIITCGRNGGICYGNVKLANDLELHEVRCCNDRQLPQWIDQCTDKSMKVYGKSHIGGKCYRDQTYERAKCVCELDSGRLCTKEELVADCARGSGCAFDVQMIWTQSV